MIAKFQSDEAEHAMLAALAHEGVFIDEDPVIQEAIAQVARYLRMEFPRKPVTWYGTAGEEVTVPDEIIAAYLKAEDDGTTKNVTRWRKDYPDWNLGFSLDEYDNRLWLTWSISDSGTSGVNDYMLIGE